MVGVGLLIAELLIACAVVLVVIGFAINILTAIILISRSKIPVRNYRFFNFFGMALVLVGSTLLFLSLASYTGGEISYNSQGKVFENIRIYYSVYFLISFAYFISFIFLKRAGHTGFKSFLLCSVLIVVMMLMKIVFGQKLDDGRNAYLTAFGLDSIFAKEGDPHDAGCHRMLSAVRKKEGLGLKKEAVRILESAATLSRERGFVEDADTCVEYIYDQNQFESLGYARSYSKDWLFHSQADIDDQWGRISFCPCYVKLSKLYEETADLKSAEKTLITLADSGTSGTAEIRCESTIPLGKFYVRQGRLLGAKESLRKLCGNEPLFLASFFATHGLIADAEKEYLRAAARAESPFEVESLARFYARQKREGDVERIYRETLQRFPMESDYVERAFPHEEKRRRPGVKDNLLRP